ncbi:unnamed protein product [Cylindrotheca closterium]|uniref:Chromo domain-containing protein n=1 Tax=Cylindrotheca closterium TaxID=2856 RepID=A0AAD2JLV3_9STRA|nr:unnamed protein product [Cylindrotheca closterium]
MITNIESIGNINGTTSVTPDSGYDFGGAGYDGEFESESLNYSDDNITLSIDTLRSSFSLPFLEDEVQRNRPKISKESFATSTRVMESISSKENGSSISKNSTRHVVKSPFLEKPLPIPNFKFDANSTSTHDDDDACSLHNQATQLPCERFADDSSRDSTLEKTPLRKRKSDHTYLDPRPFRRSSRKRKPVDFGKRNLEVSSSDSEDEHPSSERREPRREPRRDPSSFPCSPTLTCRLLDRDDVEPKDGFYDLQATVSRRIKQDSEVPIYEYLCRWNPTWEPASMVEKKKWKGEGSWKLELILDTRMVRDGDMYAEEYLCKWADSWEPEDNLSDEALRVAQSRFRDGNGNEDDEIEQGNGSDDSTEGKFSFNGVVHDTRLERVTAQRESAKEVVRRIVKQKMHDERTNNIANAADE